MDAKFEIFHPHNPEVVEALVNNASIIDNTQFITEVIYNKLFNHTDSIKKSDNLILMSADTGGFKPLMKLCDNIKWEGDTYSAAKYRLPNGNGLMQVVDKKDFGGKDVLIIDDISVRGGTFKGLAKLLKQRNVGKLYLAVSHITVQNLGEDPVTNYFDKVFTTNSKFFNYDALDNGKHYNPENLEIIKMFNERV